jgi:ubiquinone/menaquinone biosynthesis C-methylase UbiE
MAADEPDRRPRQGEVYSVGYGPGIHRWHTERTAANRAGFLLPYLQSGMRLLDCGCGPGSITVGLAEAVTPGQVVGVDLEPRQVERARALAAERGVANVRFEPGNIYELPFGDATFDAVFAHNVLEHLGDPLRALQEMRRVLKSDGLVGVRDPDLSVGFFVPSTVLLEEATRLLRRVREHNGSSPHYARHQRRLLSEAGFPRTEGFAFAEYQGNADAIHAFADALIEVLRAPETADVAVSQGWADRARLDAMAQEVRVWSECPHALHVLVDCAAIGWTRESASL